MKWLRYIPSFVRMAAYDAIAAEVTAVTLPIPVPEFDVIKTTLLAKIHAILLF